jgi:hypothetical protein
VGVIEASERLEGRIVRIELAGEQAVEIDVGRAVRLDRSRGGQEVGTLLLAGSHAGEQWYMSLTEMQQSDCFGLHSDGSDDGDHVIFDIGLRLPKADDFDPGPVRDGRYDTGGADDIFCITPSGEVLSFLG